MTSQGFWNKFGSQLEDREICVRVVRNHYGGCGMEEFEEQGYCSCTLLATPSKRVYTAKDTLTKTLDEVERDERSAFIVQLRPAQHALDLSIARAASITYTALAPSIKLLELSLHRGMLAYEMEKLEGVPLSRLQRREQSLNPVTRKRLECLITSFVDFIAQGWQSPHKVHSTSRTARADSPMEESLSMLSQCRGKVGSTITNRLGKLSAELPDTCLRKRARETSNALQRIKDYPIILSHGDLIPSNILVDPNTWAITGLVDWAEAEYLPFGTCLYGLDHLLGYLTPCTPDVALLWDYFDGAAQLREMFWMRLIDAMPELKARVEDVKVMRDVGVLLWNGIAWDDGAIDRVVNEIEDVEEVTKLRAFLSAG